MRITTITILVLLTLSIAALSFAADPPARTWGQLLHGDRTASDAWNVYQSNATAMELPLQYSEFDFYNLDSRTRSKLADDAEARCNAYALYTSSFSGLGLSPISKGAFCASSIDDNKTMAADAAQAAQTYLPYQANMSRMDQQMKSATNWLSMKVVAAESVVSWM